MNQVKFSSKLALVFFAVLLALLPLSSGQQIACAQEGKLIVSVIDVGQGDSIFAEFPNGQTMLVDAGESSAGSAVVKYIRSRGTKKIDILVASHPHADHIGGMLQVLEAFEIGKVWDSGYNHGSETQRTFLDKVLAKYLQYGHPRAGFSQQLGDVRLDVLAPGDELLSGTDSDANNSSLVIRISYGSTSFLLTGDMQDEERQSVSAWPRSTVLKVAHHGSHNGIDAAFADQVRPQYAAISCGAGNSYGHPHSDTLNALKNIFAQVYRTDKDGSIVFTSDGKNVTAKTLGASDASPPGSSISSGSSGGKGATPAAPSGSGSYIGNRNTHKFHRPSCSYLPDPKNRVYFGSRQEAINAGYVPCKKCNP